MPISEIPSPRDEIIAVLKRYSGTQSISPDDMIGFDVGISGADGILAADELEEMFNVDLAPLIKDHTEFLPARFIDRLLGRQHGPAHTDMRVKELIEYIEREIAGDANKAVE